MADYAVSNIANFVDDDLGLLSPSKKLYFVGGFMRIHCFGRFPLHWYKNRAHANDKVIFDNGYTLFIGNLTFYDQGKYSCKGYKSSGERFVDYVKIYVGLTCK